MRKRGYAFLLYSYNLKREFLGNYDMQIRKRWAHICKTSTNFYSLVKVRIWRFRTPAATWSADFLNLVFSETKVIHLVLEDLQIYIILLQNYVLHIKPSSMIADSKLMDLLISRRYGVMVLQCLKEGNLLGLRACYTAS